MILFGKYIYIAFFVTLFLFTTAWEYFRNGNWALLNNFLYSLWLVIFIFVVTLLFRSKKR